MYPFPSGPCPTGQFRCGSGECISDTLKCNLYNDCADGSDELNCTYNYGEEYNKVERYLGIQLAQLFFWSFPDFEALSGISNYAGIKQNV